MEDGGGEDRLTGDDVTTYDVTSGLRCQKTNLAENERNQSINGRLTGDY